MSIEISVEKFEWHDEGLCAQTDPDLFFQELPGSENPEAKATCRKCPVRLKCLDFAITNDEEYGVWGGLTPNARVKFKRKMRDVTPANINKWDRQVDQRKWVRLATRTVWDGTE